MAGKNKERSINPVLAMRKNQRKKEIKKTKQNRIQQKTAVLKQKDVHELIIEMENLDKLEVESIRKGYFNENTLREKKYRIRQTITQMISLYEKENKEKSKEIKAMLTNYDLRKNANNNNVENSLPPKEDDNVTTKKEEIKKLLPNIPMPVASIPLPPSSSTITSENKTVVMSDIKVPSTIAIEPFPTVAWLPTHLNPAPPPPCLPPADAPALPDHLKNAVYHGPLPTAFFQPQNIIHSPSNVVPKKIATTVTQPRKLVQEIDANANYTAESTLSAKPVLKDLQAEVTKLIPTTLQMKRNKPSTIATTTSISANNPQKKDKILENFMREINDLS